MENPSRRSFLGRATIASALAGGELLNLNPRARGANEKVVLALVGGRNQGGDDAVRAIQQGAEIKTFCDIDQAILDKISPTLENHHLLCREKLDGRRYVQKILGYRPEELKATSVTGGVSLAEVLVMSPCSISEAGWGRCNPKPCR